MKNRKTEGGTLLSQTHQICQRVWYAVLKRNELEDLAGARGRIIFALWNEDKIPIKKLVEKTSIDKATLTGIIDRLERDGYVKRVQSKEDKRVTLVCRTGKDEIFKKKIPQASKEQNKLFYSGFSTKEIKEFENYLKRILHNCKEAEEQLSIQ